MPMNLMHQISALRMPYVTRDGGEIERLRILSKAGHVLCELPSEHLQKRHAVVHEVTALGRVVLRHFGPTTSSGVGGGTGAWH